MFSLPFKGGIYPPACKAVTAGLPIEPLPPPDRVVIPLLQHVGTPAGLTVRRGDSVKVGQVLGEPSGPVSAAVCCSVSGKVLGIGDYPGAGGRHVLSVEVENDGADEAVDTPPFGRPWRDAAPGELVQAIAAAGIVGMSGAGFPTHVKLSLPSDKNIEVLIINGIEGEPYLAADHRLLVEKTEEILTGALILRKIVGADKIHLAVQSDKAEALRAVEAKLAAQDTKEVSLVKLRPRYPQGNERLLIGTITKRSVPVGAHSMDVGCMVQSAATVYAVWEAILRGTPLYRRVVTVAGPTVSRPKNLLVRIGTPLRAMLDACGVDWSRTRKVVVGGPLTGEAVSESDVPVTKTMTGVLAFDTLTPAVQEKHCIRCGHCHKACPMRLVPAAIARHVARDEYAEAGALGVSECIECGACAYVCPSKINLVQYLKLGKHHVQARQVGADAVAQSGTGVI